jgi:hypothetical protein
MIWLAFLSTLNCLQEVFRSLGCDATEEYIK